MQGCPFGASGVFPARLVQTGGPCRAFLPVISTAGFICLGRQEWGSGRKPGTGRSGGSEFSPFSPLRRRVQHVVDRRFNRARYDADLTVAAFAARLKDEVDLDSVRADLATMVTRTLEPAHLSVWLRERE